MTKKPIWIRFTKQFIQTVQHLKTLLLEIIQIKILRIF